MTLVATNFLPVVKQPALVSRFMFGAGTTLGGSKQAQGDLVLANDDGALDFLIPYGFDARRVVVRRAQRVDGALPTYPSGWETLLTHTMEQAEATQKALTIRLRDQQYLASVPLQTRVYGGTNALPAGLDGVSDIAGTPIPIVYGAPKNVTPVCVNTAKLIYQVADVAIADVTAVADKGVPLAPGGSYASLAELQNDAFAPAAGFFKVCYDLEGTYIRLGSSPQGQVTCDPVEGATLADRTAAQVYQRLLVDRANVPPSRILASDLTTLDAANGAELGFYARDAMEVAPVLDQVAGSVGAWWGVSRLGDFRLKRVIQPASPAVLTLTQDNVAGLERIPVEDEGRGIPAWRVNVRYAKNWTVQSPSALVAAGGPLTQARINALGQEWQNSVVEDAVVKDRHPLSPELTIDTLLTTQSDADAEADRLLTLRSVHRDRLQGAIPLDDVTLLADIGDDVLLTHPRFNLAGGRYCVLTGIEPDPVKRQITVTMWG